MEFVPVDRIPSLPRCKFRDEVTVLLEELSIVGRSRSVFITGFETAFADAILEQLAPLADPLSKYVPPPLAKPAFKQRSEVEAQILDDLPPISVQDLCDVSALKACLRQIASKVHQRPVEFRKLPVTTQPGFRGNVIAYPPAEVIEGLLGVVAQTVSRHGEHAIFEIAAYMMVACTTIHPFMDGNGRTARTLFNLVLRSEYPDLPYIGINEISLFAAGDFMIATNRVHFQDDWGPYLEWLKAVLHIHLIMQRGLASGA